MHEGGLARSVKATIDKRYGRIYTAIIEISSVLDDYRIDTIGGIKAGLEIFELALIPALLHNADTWLDIDEKAEEKLEKLQNTMFRYLFAVPESTPKPILRFDLGNLSIKEKIHVKKLNLIHHLKYLDPESLGNEFYHLQVKLNLPGLVKECRNLIRIYNLPDIIDSNLNYSKESWKTIVKKHVRIKSELDVKKQFENYSKLKYLNTETETLKQQEYISNLSLKDARTKFRIRSHMINTKYNRKSDKAYAADLWRCDQCRSVDTQSHILWCPAFAPLREGKSLEDDKDLVCYFQEVMRIRNDTV